MVRAGDQVVTSAGEAQKAPLLEIEFRDGRINASPTEGPDTPPAPAKPRKASKPQTPPEQGSLF